MNASVSSLPGPHNVTRATFDNGITVLVRENRAAPVVVLEGSLATGSLHDPLAKLGLSSFAAGMLTRGSEHFDYHTFNDTIESVGAALSASSDLDQLSFGLTSLSEDFPRLITVLADMLRRPTFPEPHIELVRQRRLIHLQERDQDTASVANLNFYKLVYPDHPYGRPGSGYAETINSIQRADLLDFHARRFTPQGAVIAIAGDVQAAAVLDLLQKHFGDWRGATPDRSVPPLATSDQVQSANFALADKVQSDIVLGCRAVARHHPDFFAVRVANTILGVFGMMGRLGEVVREQQGLAYYCYSAQDPEQIGGSWLAAAGVNPAHVPQAIESILHEFERMGSDLVADHELTDSQDYLTGALPLTLETNGGVASTLLDIEWLGLGLDYLQRYNGLIYGISAEDVRRVAHQYLRGDTYALVVAGPE